MRHFYSWFVWSWQWEQSTNRESRAPLVRRVQPQSLPCGRVWAGSGVMTAGHDTLSHRSSSVLQTCEPGSPDLTECSICQQDRTTLYADEDRKFSFMWQKSSQDNARVIQQSKSSPLDSRRWTDGLIMYSIRVWIWNIPAGLTPPCWDLACTQSQSRSFWPAHEGKLIEELW